MTTHSPHKSEILLATLGTEPQVVTITLDMLRERGRNIQEVVVIHTAKTGEPSLSALARLRPEMRPYHLTYREVEIQHNGQPLSDIENELGAEATFRTIYQEVAQAKRQGKAVHLCIAGGRKTMAVYGMSTAQLLFDQHDCLWHLVSFGRLLQEKRMHRQPGDEVSLVPIPIIRWSGIPPAATEIGRLLDPQQALQAVSRRQSAEQARQIDTFVEQVLTQAERELVMLAVQQHDWTYRQLGQALQRSWRTVDHQLQAIYRKLESHFALEQVNRTTLVAILGTFFSDQ